MKLNNKGWGTFQMAWMMGIILFFFLLAIILICNYYHDRGYQLTDKKIITEKNHEQMLDDLNIAGERYVNHYYKNLKNMSNIRITSDKLYRAGLFAKDLYSGCTGYVIAGKKDGIINTNAYIKCGSYKSPGYDNN